MTTVDQENRMKEICKKLDGLNESILGSISLVPGLRGLYSVLVADGLYYHKTADVRVSFIAKGDGTPAYVSRMEDNVEVSSELFEEIVRYVETSANKFMDRLDGVV